MNDLIEISKICKICEKPFTYKIVFYKRKKGRSTCSPQCWRKANSNAQLNRKECSKETREKLSLKLSGLKRSLETRQKMSQSQIGKKLSTAIKKKLAEQQLGRKLNIETREKIGQSLIGKVTSLETKRKQSQSRLGHIRTKADKNKQRETCAKKRVLNFERNQSFSNYGTLCAFRFNVYNFPNLFNLSLISQCGWYHSTLNQNGICKDHRLSVRDGFNQNIDPRMIAHPINCELMQCSKNASKGRNSSITKEQLEREISIWELSQKKPK